MTAPKATGYFIAKRTAKQRSRGKKGATIVATASTKAEAIKKLDELTRKASTGTRFTISQFKAVRARVVK